MGISRSQVEGGRRHTLGRSLYALYVIYIQYKSSCPPLHAVCVLGFLLWSLEAQPFLFVLGDYFLHSNFRRATDFTEIFGGAFLVTHTHSHR